MLPKPYVGITGVVSAQEAEDVEHDFNSAGFVNTTPQEMIGVLVSLKTLHGLPAENRRYPPVNKLMEIFSAVCGADVLSMVHYNSREHDTLAEQVEQVFEKLYDSPDGERLCRAVQLNVVWPKVEQVKRMKTHLPELQIVLQLSQAAMEGYTPGDIAARVREYGNVLSYVLIDPSGGRGLEFDQHYSVQVYRALRAGEQEFTIGFAGGFSPRNVERRVRAIIKQVGHRDFCIDAEGALRDKLSQKYGDDVLNLRYTRVYARRAGHAFQINET